MLLILCFAAVLAIGSGLPPPLNSDHAQVHKAVARPGRQADNCPITCPKGWVKWIGSSQCYLMPSKPAPLDTFWNWDARCKSIEPTSYIAVSSNWAEQAVGAAVMLQFAVQWFTNLGTSFVWLGGYTKPGKWYFLDGSDQTGSIFFVGAFGASLSGIPNGTCLSSSPWLLSWWESKDCNNKAGTAICEMAPRPVCGEAGGSYLAIAPLQLTYESLVNYFPRLPEVPYVKQIFHAFGFDNAINHIGSTLKCYVAGQCGSDSTQVTPLPDGCRWDCPDGWYSFNPGAIGQCYLPPDFDLLSRQGKQMPRDNYWTAQLKCTKTEATSNLLVINSFVEMAQIEYLLKRFSWDAANPGALLWLGGYTADQQWKFLDGSTDSGNVIMALNNLRDRSGSVCLAADLSNGGKWQAVPCDQKSGLFICEMPKKQICSSSVAGGKILNIDTPVDMSFPHWQQLFPNAQQIPFLDDYFAGRYQQPIDLNNATSSSAISSGVAVAQVLCVKTGTGWFTSIPDYVYLENGGYRATINGQWKMWPCKSGSRPMWSFQTSASSVVSAWSRCYKRGYETAMPVWMPWTANLLNTVSTQFSGYYPFQVGDKLAPYFDYNYNLLTGVGLKSRASDGIRSTDSC